MPIRHFRVGEIVVPDQHPADCDRWQVVETDGIYLTLEPTRPSVLRRMRRHARTVRPA